MSRIQAASSTRNHLRHRSRLSSLLSVLLTVGLTATSLIAADAAEAAPGTLLSLKAQTSASSSESNALAPRYAVDGDPKTRWASRPTDAQWFRIDLGRSYPVERVELDWEAAYGRDFTIQLSEDAITWTTAATTNGGKGKQQRLDVSGSARYVQLVGTKRGTGYGYSLFEFRVFGNGEIVSPVDPPKWNDEVTHHEFQANCTFSKFAADDPIVYPGLPGASHLHTFIGNTSTDAFTTPESLLANAGTTCSVPQDRSAYWFPTLFKGDQPVQPNIPLTVYYKAGVDDYTSVKPFPAGLRFVAGDMMATIDSFRTAPGAVEGWECGDISKSWSIPRSCAPGSQLNLRYQAPSCWDGVNLAPIPGHMGHSNHMAYPVSGQCPTTHPVPVPMLEFKIAWPVSGDMSDVRLASGSDQSWHYDFINAWDQDVLGRLVKQCINGGLQCNPRGFDQYKPQRGTVLDEQYRLVG